MKVAFIKEKNDFRLLRNSLTWEEIKNINLYELHNMCGDIPFLGYILSAKCDFYINEDIVDDNILSEYDVILTINPFLKNKFSQKQIMCFFEGEPNSFSHALPYTKYDYFLNNFSTRSDNKNICCPYVYATAFFDEITSSIKKESRKVFKQKATELKLVQNFISEDYGNRSYCDYFKDVARCEYAINLCTYSSAGQVIAECSLLNVICFARSHKSMSQLLLPDFCYVSNEEEAVDKINHLEKNIEFKQEIRNKIRENVLKNISLNTFEQILNSIIYN